MKTLTKILLSLILLLSWSCSKDEAVLPEGYSANIRGIISPDIFSKLTNTGMKFNPGTNPPDLSGIYVLNPFVLVADWDPNDQSDVGTVCSCNAVVRFTNQSANKQSIHVDLKLGTGSNFTWNGYLSGEGNKFTFFVDWNGTFDGEPAQFVTVISGEISASGLLNYYDAAYIKGKGSNSPNVLVGEFRIRFDHDGFSEPTMVF
ncbi:hypothetical protein CLV98_102474 [Dyadobacter jejuensis]|uniref:Uncharacterized protein n=1 Tax=Dyadobacter jejuensis TaxID=1082580 RepID=A0A316AS16_9BACT|nr:hypothetical protein [Dyadobacter jejuensis]PWJ59640.1 hypothetical protein CLV98_102474 [Dyadobacter jejuensis]